MLDNNGFFEKLAESKKADLDSNELRYNDQYTNAWPDTDKQDEILDAWASYILYYKSKDWECNR